jgi:hypothetical protein
MQTGDNPMLQRNISLPSSGLGVSQPRNQQKQEASWAMSLPLADASFLVGWFL